MTEENLNQSEINDQTDMQGLKKRFSFLQKKSSIIIIGVILCMLIITPLLLLSAMTPSTDTTLRTEPTIRPETVQRNITTYPTLPIETEAMQKAVDEAKQSAKEYDTWQADVWSKYPWLRKLPLASSKYYVYFDLNKKVFIGKLYPSPEDNIDQMKITLVEALKTEKGIPMEDFTVEWTVFPQ